GVIEAEFMKQHHIAHRRICARVCKEVARWGDEKYFGSLPVEGWLNFNAGDGFYVFREEINAGFYCMRFEAEVVAFHIASSDRAGDPADIKPQQIEKLPAHHGDFSL